LCRRCGAGHDFFGSEVATEPQKVQKSHSASSTSKATSDGPHSSFFAGTDNNIQVTDLIAQSFIKIFNNAFLNTIERVREPHIGNVLTNLKNFAARVPPKYRGSIDKALRTEGFLSFLLSRAAISLLVAKATLPRDASGQPTAQISKEHEELATVVEELYIAAMLHAENQWEWELKADGKTFMDVATSFMKHLANATTLKAKNIQAALLGVGANPLIWTRYGIDMIGITMRSMGGSMRSMGGSGHEVAAPGTDSPQTADKRK
ncbi:unnamed protein product, partial [Polarella glacialis]